MQIKIVQRLRDRRHTSSSSPVKKQRDQRQQQQSNKTDDSFWLSSSKSTVAPSDHDSHEGTATAKNNKQKQQQNIKQKQQQNTKQTKQQQNQNTQNNNKVLKTKNNNKKKQVQQQKKKETLPDTWYYSSNHILVNRERAVCGLTQLKRTRVLDELARFHAENMADDGTLFHSVDGLPHLKAKLGNVRYAGENVQRGKSIRWMHTAMMASGKKSRDNILSKKYTEFGMGTAKGSDGKLYMAQLFRCSPPGTKNGVSSMPRKKSTFVPRRLTRTISVKKKQNSLNLHD